MDECPAVEELVSLVESGTAGAGLVGHVRACEACQASLTALERDLQALQISISTLWFSERISCPEATTLDQYRSGRLGGGAREYVEFHLTDLACPHCQATLAVAEARGTEEGRRRITRSRERVGEATTSLLKDLRRPGR